MARKKPAKPDSGVTAVSTELWRNRIVGYGEEPPGQLVPNPKNWRTHPKAQSDALSGLLRGVGLVQNVVVNKRTGRLVDGHLRVTEAIRDKQPTVPITYVDLDEAEEALVLASLDPLAAMAEANKDALASLLSGVKVEAPALRDMLEALGHQFGIAATGAPGLTEDDAVPEPPEAPVTVLGDVWILGDHRLACGDATSVDAVERLVDGRKADMVFTDPPYNVDYEGYTEDRLKIQGDQMTTGQFRDFLLAAFASCRIAVTPAAALYVCHSSSWQREFQDALEDAGFEIRCQIIWAKNTFAWGFGRYKFQHEPIFYCHVAGQSDAWYGDKSQSTLWQENKPAANRLHPTMKPVELVGRALQNSSKAGDIVVDLFGGSGTTLIACEKTGRMARLMELDPRYCDVIVKRWQEFTGKKAILEVSGQEFDVLAAERSGVAA